MSGGGSAEGEARRALARLGRALEKVRKELDALEGALRHAEGSDFPRAEYDEVLGALSTAERFVEAEGDRLQQKILQQGGLEPGRVRRSSGF